jgi:hypothetical protein
VDKAGDLKFGSKKCRLHKKDEVVKVAKEYGIRAPGKKTVKDLCVRLKKKIQQAARVSRKEVANMNNVPLAKLYPKAAKKRAEKKVAANFMKSMVTNNANIAKLRQLNVKTPPKPSKKAKPLTKKEAIKRISAMKGLNKEGKFKLKIRVEEGVMSPRRVVKVARELSRLNAPGYRVTM